MHMNGSESSDDKLPCATATEAVNSQTSCVV